METRELGIKELQYVSLLPNKSSPPIYFVQYTLTKKKKNRPSTAYTYNAITNGNSRIKSRVKLKNYIIVKHR